MGHKAGATSKAFPAIGARIGLLSRVNSLVSDQVGINPETLPTNVTFVRFLTRMYSLVFNKV